MKMLIVAGTWDEKCGHPSGVARKIHEELRKRCEVELYNGGNIQIIKDLEGYVSQYNCIIWMPNISNDEDKILPLIKKWNPTATLVSSKNMMEKDYQLSDVVGHLLKNHSNLGIAIHRSINDKFSFTLLDPLGNRFVETVDIELFVKVLWRRLFQLSNVTRVKSISSLDTIEIEKEKFINPDFITVVRDYADKFSKHVNAVNPNRMLGNASTRCSFGFPSFREGQQVFVSKRNIDKSDIDAYGFVAVSESKNRESILYYGFDKPSVDTPIQLKLYEYYKNIKYMIHGHVYILYGAEMTRGVHPCGSLEEAKEIIDLYPDPDAKRFVVNLRGHGCLIASDDLDFFNSIELCSRLFPEDQVSL